MEMFSVEATRPATSTTAPRPNTMPFGLIRNTRPFDCREPRIWLGSPPVTRFSTWLALDCWMKRVTSPAPMENDRQSMMALGELVMVSVEPCCWNAAVPLPTVGSSGLANALVPGKQEAIASATSDGCRIRWVRREGR